MKKKSLTIQGRGYAVLRGLVRRHASPETRAMRSILLDLYRQGVEASLGAEGEPRQSASAYDISLGIAQVASAELLLDTDSIAAHLLFSLPESAKASALEHERLFSSESKRLLSLMERTRELYTRSESINKENFDKLLLSMAEDIRVVMLLIADRLYRLRHARELYSPEERKSLAEEVAFLYAPTAHRLGLYTIKGEMEDLCLKYRDPKTFEHIVKKLGETKQDRDLYIKEFLSPLRQALDAQVEFAYEMKGRTKSISSIHNKLRKQQFEDIYDLFAIRIILDVPTSKERQACWQVYSIVTDMYRPNPERLKDWISIPKSNGYESLHITVMGHSGRWVEVQIRTKRMDEIAEQGLAAHWRYKGIKGEKGLDDFLTSVRDLLESVKDTSEGEGRTILESSKLTLKTEEIYAFTPKGEVLKLPKGATVLDFAFCIHSKVGERAVSGKVNGKNVSLRYQLQNGDSVEILTNPQQTPKRDWLSIAVSSKAKGRIRAILRAEEEAGIDVAKELIQRRIKNRKLVWDESLFIRLISRRGFKAITDFYRAITQSKVDPQAFVSAYEEELLRLEQVRSELAQATRPIDLTADQLALEREDKASRRTTQEGDPLIIDQGLSGVDYTFAKCCTPVYGDGIFGFVSGSGIKIHRLDCPNAHDLIERSPHKVLPARWAGEGAGAQTVTIDVIGRDDVAVVTNVISLIRKEPSCKLNNYSLDSADGLFRASFRLYVEGSGGVTSLVKKIRGAVGVKQVQKL